MAKKSNAYICNSCSYESPKWMGQCPSCSSWNTFEEVDLINTITNSDSDKPIIIKKLSDYKVKEGIKRISTGFSEFDRVLGGGLVPSSVILISGEPGIGKSTLLMQVLGNIDNALYVSAEESIDQVALRGKRIKISSNTNLNILSSYDLDSIISKVKEIKPRVMVIDSIQTVYLNDVRGLPGGIAQIKAVSSKLIKFAKENEIIMFLVGQVTKEGYVAGPKLLEHLVDVVLEIEGDQKLDFRILRSLKNRFGANSEVGIFEMLENGMEEVLNPSIYFLGDINEKRTGVCPGVVMEGLRYIFIEMQALTNKTFFPLPKRVSEGYSRNRLEVLTAIIAKYTKYDLSTQDVYISIAGGLKSSDSILDLPTVLSIISSYTNKALPKGIIAFGEISLTGQIRLGKRYRQIEKECERLGYKSFNKVYKHIKNISQLFLFFKDL